MQGASVQPAARSDDSHDTGDLMRIETDRKIRLVRNLIWCAWPIFFYFSIHSFLQNNFIIGSVTSSFTCITTILYVFTRVFTRPLLLTWALRVFMMLLAALFLFYIIISDDHYGMTLWSYTFPLVVFFGMGPREGVIWASCYWILQLLLMYGPGGVILNGDFSAPFKLRFVVSHALVAVMAFFFETGRHQAQLAMHVNQSRFKASENRTRKAYEELKIAQSQLVQSGKLASIGELAAGVAHELNQPLMVIRGYSQLIHRQMKSQRLKEKELYELLETIERNTKRMIIIINHLRAFSRQSTAGFQTMDLNRVIEDAFLMIGEQLRLRGIHVVKHLDTAGAFIQGDAHQLEQVFLNLLSNARDALSVSPTGYKRRRSDRRITITTRRISDPARVEVMVSDNGYGIPAKNLEAIFDPFFTTKEVGKGTGLGLSISYGIIQKHGGRIEVKETGSDGTTFALTLPALQQPTARGARQTAIRRAER
jgi:signal transduction histidine kinase